MSRRLPTSLLFAAVAASSALALPVSAAATPEVSEVAGAAIPFPLLYVTQMPIASDFATIGSVFANHEASMQQVGRGGDLMLLSTNGTVRNLTQEAGYGVVGFQGPGAIAVRNPAMHWEGTKAVFSMVIGAPDERYLWEEYRWQLYEVSNLFPGPAVITKVPNQPESYNNVMPVYGSDDRILFASDRPRSGEAHLYPQRDEYESEATNTGLWSLDPATGDLFLVGHSPSGSFWPIVDSFGRVVFTRWDHLQRDQQGDGVDNPYGAFNYSDESAGAIALTSRAEVFPEPRVEVPGSGVHGHRINHFFPWQVLEDGTQEEVLNHLGRHELHSYFDFSFADDTNLEEFIAPAGRKTIENMLQIREDPSQGGRFVGIDAPEFYTHAAGMLFELQAAPDDNADSIAVTYLTHPSTRTFVGDGETPPAAHSGHYRNPLALSDGSLVVAHTAETRAAGNDGSRTFPDPRYDFRLKRLVAGSGPSAGYLVAGAPLTSGTVKSLTYWDPDELVSYSGELWELDPVEVRSTVRPARLAPPLPAAEQAVFDDLGVDPQALSADLRRRGVALMSVRNLTSRDDADRQQPFDLQVAGGGEVTVDPDAQQPLYQVAHLQAFQGDQIRGYDGPSTPSPGRRVLARVLHDPAAMALNPPNAAGPPGSVPVAADGSVALFVPARRAMAWQSTDAAGTPVVRERYWITFQPGEIRVCDSCHGVNQHNQAAEEPPGTPPEAPQLLALRQAVLGWMTLFSDGFESGDLSAW